MSHLARVVYHTRAFVVCGYHPLIGGAVRSIKQPSFVYWRDDDPYGDARRTHTFPLLTFKVVVM